MRENLVYQQEHRDGKYLDRNQYYLCVQKIKPTRKTISCQRGSKTLPKRQWHLQQLPPETRTTTPERL